MANITCPHCGNPLRLLGLAAICPHCGQLVMADAPPPRPIEPESADDAPIPLVPEESAAEASTPKDSSPPINEPLELAVPYAAPVQASVPFVPEVSSGRSESFDLPPLPPADPEAEVAPAPLPADALVPTAEPVEWNPLLIGASIVGAVIVVLLTVVLLFVFRPGGAVPPPAAPIRTIAPAAAPPAPSPPPPASVPVIVEAPPSTVPAVRPLPPHALLARLTPTSQPLPGLQLTDAQIGDSITRGINYLLPMVSGPTSTLQAPNAADLPGVDSLAVYALLNAGLAVGDSRLAAQTPLTNDLLDRIKAYPIAGSHSTYCHSLRASALSLFHRPQDRAAIDADQKWLLTAAIRGEYGYDLPNPGIPRDGSQSFGDNSNSQYGALGVWAASGAGVIATPQYWGDIERHWMSWQHSSGGWGYHKGDDPTLSMTAAGITMLFVARDQMTINSAPSQNYIPLTKQQQAALDWLAFGNHAVDLSGARWRGYALYGLERAGLACGYKYFGQHDWYAELAADSIKQQSREGGWSGESGPICETAFNLLFLSRGRHPVFMSKLRFDGAWQNRPRDLDTLTRYASEQLERPLNWQVAEIEHDWWTWSDAPTVLLTSNHAFTFTDEQAAKLRAFALAGGLIFCNTERSSAEADDSVDALAKRLFPDLPLAPVPPDHPIYSLVYTMVDPPPLRAVSNGARLLLVHSSTDLARWWQPFPPKSQRMFSQLAINIGVYATGQRDLRNRLSTIYVPQSTQPAIGTIPLARLQYEGAWDPEPAAWVRAGRQLQIDTGLAMEVKPVRLADLRFEDFPVADLTGLAKFSASDADVAALREFLRRGGTLLIDACGGSTSFGDFVANELLPKLAPNLSAEPIGDNAPLRRSGKPGMNDLHEIKLRPDLKIDRPTAPYQIDLADGGTIVFSRLDLTNGLLGGNTAGIAGYAPQWCQDFVENVLVWTLARLPKY